MNRRRFVALLAGVAGLLPLVPANLRATTGTTIRSGLAYAQVTDTEIVAGNQYVERKWDRRAFATTALTDVRSGGRSWASAGPHRDFTLRVAGAEIGSDAFEVTQATASDIDNGVRIDLSLAGPAGLSATRVIEVYDGIAGFRTQTFLSSAVPLPVAGYTLDEVAVGPSVAPTLHAFRAGADWREPGWEGPGLAIGDPHAGTWRDTRTAEAGQPLAGPAQWVSVADAETGGRTLFQVMERNDLPSSRAYYDGAVVALDVDFNRDVVSLGPIEEQGHVENPAATPGVGRARTVMPGQPLALESAFTGLGTSTDDEAWQHARYLTGRRLEPYAHDVVFNSNGTDDDRISTGAKDDMDFATIQQVAPVARALGIETFVLDDGWQAISGDWYPDSPEHPEPRWDGDPASTFAPRFPDSTFAAVRDAIAPMKLGLWMSPLQFNPSSATYRAHPDWACAPVGHALAGVNALQPGDGSNEAGIGTWSAAAIPHVETRIREAIQQWGVEYFKFDFLAWLDCAGEGDLYDLHDAFVAMLDRLRHEFPAVTFQIDETNDYRLFPFESVSRGPSWFQNGSPGPQQLLHNLWDLSPYVPTWSIGQHVLGGNAYATYPVDTLVAAALPSHITVFSDIRNFPPEVVDAAAPWLAFYRAHRDLLGGMAYPLLDDPLADGWTALQPWDADLGQGSLLVFRQDSPEATHVVALRGVPPGRMFDLIEAPSGTVVATKSSEELLQGIEISLPATNMAKVLLVVPAGTGPVPQPAPQPIVPGKGEWLAGDLHVHTCYSHDAYCGPDDDNTTAEEAYTLSAPVEERFAEAAGRGLDFLAVTDHNDVRSVADAGFGTHGVIGVPGYEASLSGHAQMLGATRLYDEGDASAPAVNAMAADLRATGGVFQINHPAESLAAPFACDDTALLDWGYGYDVVPDTVEVWNIGHHYQPPFPSASSNADAIRYWECWLERGAHIAATGGSDSHWVSTAAVQGPGNPTTWVFATARSASGVLDGLRAGRTSVSFVPPAAGGARLVLEADVDGDGTYESMMGDTVPPGTALRVRAEGLASGGLVDVRANGITLLAGAALAPGAEVDFSAPTDRPVGGWVRATLVLPDQTSLPGGASCEPVLGSATSYCRNPVAIVALTSPIYLG